MFDTLLIITLFLLASLLVCLLTLRLSINVKHLRLIFHSLLILTVFLKLRPPPVYFKPPSIKFNKNLRPPIHFDLSVYEAPKSNTFVPNAPFENITKS